MQNAASPQNASLCRSIFPALFVYLLLAHFCTSILAERLPIKIYTSADGLGSSFVDYQMRDSHGFMWFCTRDGLSRFDGSQFFTYKIAGKNSAPGFESIVQTYDDVYFVSTTGGLFYFDAKSIPQKNTSNKNTALLNAKFINGNRGWFFQDREKNLWLGSSSLYLVQREGENVSLKEIDLHLPDNFRQGLNIRNITQAQDGSLWLNSNYGVIRRLPDGRVRFYPSENVRLSALLIDREQRFWMSRGKKLQVFLPESLESLASAEPFSIDKLESTEIISLGEGKKIRLPETTGEVFQYSNGQDSLLNSPPNYIIQSSDGNIWLTTENELIELDKLVFHSYSAKQGLPSILRRIGEDSSGNLWISGQAGLIRLDRKGMVSFGLEDGLKSRDISSIKESRNGEIYFAHGDFYLSLLKENYFEAFRPSLAADVQRIWTSRFAYQDSTGEWWFLTSRGLYRFNKTQNLSEINGAQTVQIYGQKTGLSADEMFQIYEDSGGAIWLSLQSPKFEGRGLARFDRTTEKFYQFSENEGFPADKSVSSFAEDKNGNLWLGFYEGGLIIYRDGKFTVPPISESLDPGVVSDLLFDRRGRLWISSSNHGLFRIDDPYAENIQMSHLTTENGLSSGNVRTMTEDFFGNIYIGTVRGVDRISPDTMQIKHYSVSDGLASDFVVDSLCARDGTLWFATTNGLSRLIPAENEKPAPPPVRLGGLRIAGVEQNISTIGDIEIGNYELSASQNNLQIDFFGLDFRAGETLRYQYQLEGADSDWSKATEIRTVAYANLQPGSYRFLVRALNNQGVFSETPAVVSFKILPPLYLRWWFIALCFVLLFLIVWVIYRYRIANLEKINRALAEAKSAEENLRKAREERLKELQRVRTRIANDLHDDIGSSLTQIAVLSEVAKSQSGVGDADFNSPLEKISQVSNELVDTMSDVVWAINPRKDSVHELILRMRRFASDVLSARGIEFDFEAEQTELQLGANIRRESFSIFKESINNIIKHAEASEVFIKFEISALQLTMEIADNGKGFDVNYVLNDDFIPEKGGNGLLNIRRRAAELNGRCRIDSSARGTKIIVEIPLINADEEIFTTYADSVKSSRLG